MRNRTTNLAIAALALLVAAIVFAVSRLYRTAPQRETQMAPAALDVFSAIPSDAVAVFLFDGTSRARTVLADSSGLLRPLVAAGEPRLMEYLGAVSHHRSALSLHNSGSLVPLVVTSTDKLDSAGVAWLEQCAAAAGLQSRSQDGFLMASPSGTFVGASARQLREGTSILDNAAFNRAAQSLSGPVMAFVSHAHAGKLLQVYSTPSQRRKTSRLKDLTSWSAWSATDISSDKIQLKGTALPGESAGSVIAAFAGTPAQDAAFAEVLPYYTAWAVSLPVADPQATLASLRKLADAAGRLGKYDKSLKDRAGRQLSPENWFLGLQPRELVKAAFNTPDGVQREVILLRSAKDLKLGQEASNPYRGCLGLVLGEDWSVTDTLCSAVNGRWSVFGDLPSVRAFAAEDFLSYSLKDRFSDAGLGVPQGFAAYASLSDSPAVASGLFAAPLSDAVLSWVRGAGYAPALWTADLSADVPDIRIRLEKQVLKGTKVQVLERDTTVVVPTGLFPVKNAATGQTNYLYQNAHGSICLNDENGKGVWGIPFKESLCGAVESIDYYQNGKLQYLFCAGSRLWLLDRLGHWVNGFPVELGKEVLLGPAVQDFTGAGGYTVMVLHKDNTLERYNLHGIKPKDWLGIHAPETVKSLPELLETGGNRYWVVRTSVQTLLYPFEGGDPALQGEGGKMLKPDTKVTVTSKGIEAECYDGKRREMKVKK